MKTAYIAAGVLMAGALVAVVVARKSASGGVVKSVASSVGGGLVTAVADAVDGVVSGAANAAGDVVGLPRTECAECRELMDQFAAASWVDKAWLSFKVSAYCPASDYLRWLGDSNYRPSCS